MKRYARGLTLLELMTALTVLGVLLSIAIPSFRQFTINSRTTSATNDLVTALQLARSEALRRATPVIVCSSIDLANCAGARDWSTGWIAFRDPNGNNAVDGNELLQVWPALAGGVRALSNQANVAYNAMGMGQLPPGAAFAVNVGHVDCVGQRVGSTTVSIAGTVQTARINCPLTSP
jgi:type IV fimbrial biogenesis protein FimT